MILWSKIRLAAAIAIVILLPGILCINALQKWARGQDDGPADRRAAISIPTKLEPAALEFNIAKDVMVNRSIDGTIEWGFSMVTGGEWSAAIAPKGTTFDKSTLTLADGVAAIRAGNREFAFAAGTGTWDSFEIPEGAKLDVWIGPGYLRTQYGTHMWAFSTAAGKWREIDVSKTGGEHL